MPTSESSLSVAIQAAADFLADRMADDVVVTVDAPQRAQKLAEGGNSHVLNLFVYRIAPSGFHAGMGNEDATFIRVNVLLTAFPAGQGGDQDAPPDSDLRVLGQAVRVLQSSPVIPTVLPGAAPADPGNDFRNAGDKLAEYRMQAVLQAPTMEEMNHIWTTQGGELAYRLSAAYELALIPIEPIDYAEPAPVVQVGHIETVPGAGRGPFQMFFKDGKLFSHLSIPAGSAQIGVAITGQPNTRVSVTVEWQRVGGTVDSQAAQVVTLETAEVDSEQARFDVNLANAAAGDVATFQTVVVDAKDALVHGVAPGNTITLEIRA